MSYADEFPEFTEAQATGIQHAIDDAVDRAHGLSALANAMGVKHYTILTWHRRARPLPIKRAVQIEVLTGVDRRRFRPHDHRFIWPELEGRVRRFIQR